MNTQFSKFTKYAKTIKSFCSKHKKLLQIAFLVLIMAIPAIKCLFTNDLDIWFYLYTPLSILSLVFYFDMIRNIPKVIQIIIFYLVYKYIDTFLPLQELICFL